MSLLTDFEDVLVTFVCLLRKNPKAEFWTTYQVRRYDFCFQILRSSAKDV